MLGLFQADIPIGHRLWIVLLPLVFLGSLTSVPLTLPDVDPVQFVIEILLFFGYVSIISTGILFVPETVRGLVLRELDHRLRKESPYRAVVRSHKSLWLFRSLPNLAFFVGIIIAIPGFSTPTMETWGTVGLFFLLLEEILDWRDIYKKKKEIIELVADEKGKMCAKLVKDEGIEEFSVDSEWLTEIRSLLQNGWEMIDCNNSVDSRFAILGMVHKA